jgi:hypothetical protein
VRSTKVPLYDFQKLDEFLDKLTNDYGLQPTIEFMTSLNFRRKFLNSITWENLAYEISSRYLGM